MSDVIFMSKMNIKYPFNNLLHLAVMANSNDICASVTFRSSSGKLYFIATLLSRPPEQHWARREWTTSRVPIKGYGPLRSASLGQVLAVWSETCTLIIGNPCAGNGAQRKFKEREETGSCPCRALFALQPVSWVLTACKNDASKAWG